MKNYICSYPGRMVRRVRRAVRFRDNYTDHSSGTKGSKLIQKKLGKIQFIFVHIHKCAGTSFIEAIEKSPNAICCASIPGDYMGRTGRNLIPERVWEQSLKFTCVRNPYARVVSAYSMFIRDQRWKSTFPDFNSFVRFLSLVKLDEHCVGESVNIDDYKNTIDNVIHHCTPYFNPKYFIGEMDYVIKLEEIDSSLYELIHNHGLLIDSLEPRKETGSGVKYRNFYDDESRQLVSEIYRADLSQFEYSF